MPTMTHPDPVEQTHSGPTGEGPTGEGVTGGVDTHKDTHTAAVLDPTGRLLGDRQFSATPPGYTALLAWLRSFRPRRARAAWSTAPARRGPAGRAGARRGEPRPTADAVLTGLTSAGFVQPRAAAGNGESRARAHRRRSGRGGRRRLRGGLRAARGPARPRGRRRGAGRARRIGRRDGRGRRRAGGPAAWWRGSRRWTTCSPARAGWRPCWRCTSSSTAARAATARVRALRRALLRPCLSSPEPDNGAQSA